MYDPYKVKEKAKRLAEAISITERLKLVYQWVKAGDISFSEFKVLGMLAEGAITHLENFVGMFGGPISRQRLDEMQLEALELAEKYLSDVKKGD